MHVKYRKGGVVVGAYKTAKKNLNIEHLIFGEDMYMGERGVLSLKCDAISFAMMWKACPQN